MPLTLVTGPANAEKAGLVLAAVRARAGEDPVLVVPTAADRDRYRRELAEAGAVFGVAVEGFDGLLREAAARAGRSVRVPPRLVRERLAAAAARRASLDVLAASASTGGFAPALLAFFDELGEAGVGGARLRVALRAWAGEDRRRRAYGEELASLVGALEDAHGPAPAALHRAVLDELRLRPAAWGGTPVFVYGFDDLTPTQLDVVETLARSTDVTVALTYEAGRAAFASRAGVAEALRALADRHEVLEASADHVAHAELHHLERGLFEAGAGTVPAGAAIALLEGGGEREALDLAAERVAAELAAGVAPEDVAVVLREPAGSAWLVEQAFAARGVPVAVDRPVRAGDTAVGRALGALLRAGGPEGRAEDVVAWLRAPGLVRRPELVDRLEEEVRRDGLRSAAEAIARWTAWELRPPAGEGRELCEALGREAQRLAGAPDRGQAPVLAGGPAALEVRAAGVLRRALRDLGGLARRDPRLVPSRTELEGLLADLEVRPVPATGAVAVTRPQRLRARRVRALFALGLQEGAWPAPARPDPFLGDAERRALNAASGLRLRLREDRTATERLLFYEAVTRPTHLLALGWHAADEGGDPAVRSPFVDDVLARFAPGPPLVRRALGTPPPVRPAARTAGGPIRPLRAAAVLDELLGRDTFSATALEAWEACPVRWFVERWVRPEALEPDAEPLRRGGVAHRVLEDVLGAHRARHGAVRPRPEHLDALRASLRSSLRARAAEQPLAVTAERHAAALRRLEVDLLFFVERLVVDGSAFVPAAFELEVPPVPVAGGAFRLRGTIDRVDLSPDGREAVVYDYKGRTTAAPQAEWLGDGRLQLGLYMRALPQVLEGVERVVGGLYQPIGADDPRPRGAMAEGADPGLSLVATDRVEGPALEALLDEVEARAAAAVKAVRRGDLEPRPTSCGWAGGGCAYPSVCRCER